MDSFKPYLAKVATGASLTREEARAAFDRAIGLASTPAEAAHIRMQLDRLQRT